MSSSLPKEGVAWEAFKDAFAKQHPKLIAALSDDRVAEETKTTIRRMLDDPLLLGREEYYIMYLVEEDMPI